MKSKEELSVLLQDLLCKGVLLGAVLSKLRQKQHPYSKVAVRPVQLKGDLHYQFTYHYAQKVLHENLTPQEAAQRLAEHLQKTFRQAQLFTPECDYQILVSKKGALKVLKHPPSKGAQPLSLEHNRTKRYLLQEGQAYPFLVELGVMSKEGKVFAKRYHKFRQLNKYLEIVEDCLPTLQEGMGEGLTIVDFGSGKAYLTFALYHYLVEHLQLPVRLIGLDLKEDVVAFCNRMAEKLGYQHLEFRHEDIRDFEAEGGVDLVVSLHACDVATDYALAQAVKWQAKVILAVPCCQHELLRQLQPEVQPVLFKHGILKERAAALLTDAARSQLLETAGYRVQVMEFIDLEHTPKNLLIRAFREPDFPRKQAEEEYRRFKEYWNISPTLASLLEKEG